ncbi:vitellogenin receptor [Thrips palmi]|uniref:Vitellogenin receptor n=1 Tax=Thrips palmi TaxID=161013 RepID=A0A6P9A6R5_THRPL|nr:vitellogenin receptor [Thrips palmi]
MAGPSPVWAALCVLACFPTSRAFFNTDATSDCPEGTFMCLDGDCIRNSKHCDGVKDCRDGNDEWDCDFVKCQAPMYFRCKDSGKCISASFVCDEENDCGDWSDEHDCHLFKPPVSDAKCSSKEFQCLDKLCIPSDMVCDGEVDCLDGSDETLGCSSKISCDDGFMCKNHHCIPSEFKCDGSNDCTDGSDEEDCKMITHNVPIDECVPEKLLFACKDRVGCLDIHQVCDNTSHCLDDSDEGNRCSESCENCTHQCYKTPSGPVCICPKGTRLENGACVEYDECTTYGICDQKCRKQPSGYQCYCDPGYSLQKDGHSCKADGGEALMVFSAGSQIRGYYITSQNLFRIASKLGQVAGIGYDGFHIYWTNVMQGDEAIMRSNEDGSEQEVLVSAGLGLPEDLAVDWITQNVYFSDSQKKHIGVCNTDGSSCTVLVNEDIDQPRSLALLPSQRTMFWSDWGDKPMIATSGMDGSDPKVLVSSDIRWPNGLALDFHNERLYWVDAKRQKIETVKLDGSDRRVILEKVLKHPFDIAVFEGSLYWSDWEGRQIQACDKFTGKNHRVLIRERKNKVYGVHIFHSSMQHRNITNPCVDAGCSDLCVLSPNSLGYSCACPQDRELGADKHKCHDLDKRQSVIVGAAHNLYQVETRVLGKLSVTTIPLRAIHKMGALAYNSLTGSVIIYDLVQKKIYSYNLKSARIDLLVGGAIGVVSGMDFDYLGNTLYWCDVEKNTVEVLSLVTNERAVLLRDLGSEVPLDVALVPASGVMFVAFSSDSGVHIDRFNMDGTGRTHVIEAGVEGPHVSLWYDHELDRIFWTDNGLGMIDSTSVEGTDRHAFRGLATSVNDVTSISTDVFWVDRHSGLLHWADKYDGYAHEKKYDLGITEGLDAVNLVGVRGVLSAPGHPCQEDNGGCSHLCLLLGKSRVCACPDGMILKHENHTCVVPLHCTSSQFKCKSDDLCIPKSSRCNGKQECPSGEDEQGCKPTCHYGQFACDNGQCIDESLKCDSNYDCTDKSDELNCHMVECDPDTQFTCESGQCISLQWRCNFAADCHDGSDEANCEESTCERGKMFRCKSGACVPATWECDHEIDCADGSDEHDKCAPPPCDSPRFQCTNQVCIDERLKCDGHDNCGDGSDESGCSYVPTDKESKPDTEKADKPLSCTNEEFKCEKEPMCLPSSARCNGTAECVGGEDEMDCQGCAGHEFQCHNGHCIPTAWLCDKYNDCGDNSDEELKECKASLKPSRVFEASKKCTTFQCPTGECLPWSMVCNIHEDCPDASDEGGRCITACSAGHPCQGTCVRTPHGPYCSCNAGYELKGDGRTCQDINECEDDPCAQLCENTDGSFSCSCGSEFILRADKLSCKATGPPMEFIFSTGEQVRKASAKLNAFHIVAENSGLEISGLDVDARAQHVYWTTEANGILHRMSLGTGMLSHVRGLGVPTKLAVDWLSKNVYYTNMAERGSVNVCNLEKQRCARLVKEEEGAYTGAIAVDPKSSLLFWSRVHPGDGSAPVSQLMVSDLSGQNQTLLASADLISGIALDLIKRQAYWSDQHLGLVERVDYSGDNRVMIRNDDVHHPIGLNLFEDILFWINGGTGSLTKCRMYGKPQNCERVTLSHTDVKNFALLQSTRQTTGDDVCATLNCTHMCVLSLRGPKCICEDGSIIKPGKSCSTEREAEEVSVDKPSFHMVVETAEAYGKAHSASSVVGPIIGVMIVIGAAFAFLAYKRRSSPGINWPNLPLGLNIGKLGGGGGSNVTFDNQAFGMASSRQDPFEPTVKPGNHEYENPTMDGRLSMSRSAQSWSAPKKVVPVDKMQLEDDDSDAEYMDGEYDQARLIP